MRMLYISAVSVSLLSAFYSELARASPATTQVFESLRHPKAQGAQLTVAYPVGFSARESTRTQIVQTFTGTDDGVDLALSIGIEAADGDVEAFCASRTLADWRQSFQSLTFEVLQVQLKSWGGRPGVLLEGSRSMKANGLEAYSRSQTLSMCHMRYRISLTCATSGVTPSQAKIFMQKATATCDRFHHSLKFKG